MQSVEVIVEEGLAGACQIIEPVGKGAFGTVDKVTFKDRKTYALKTIHCDSRERKTLARREVYYHGLISHPNIVKVHASEMDLDNNSAYLLMDYCKGGDLGTILRAHRNEGTRLPIETAWSYFIQIAQALHYLHTPAVREGVHLEGALAHRDIKPDNMLLADEEQFEIKLADLGLVTHIQPEGKLHEREGTFNYMAPEIVLQQEYDEKADAWSLGCVGYEMLNGYHPLEGKDAKEILAIHVNYSVFDEADVERDSHLASLIEELLCARRLTMANLMIDPTFRKKMLENEVMLRQREIAKLRAQLSIHIALHVKEIEERNTSLKVLQDRLGKGPEVDVHQAARVKRLEKVRDGCKRLSRYRSKKLRLQIANLSEEISDLEAKASLIDSETTRQDHESLEESASDLWDDPIDDADLFSFDHVGSFGSMIPFAFDTPKPEVIQPGVYSFPSDISQVTHRRVKSDGQAHAILAPQAELSVRAYSDVGTKPPVRAALATVTSTFPIKMTLTEWLEANQVDNEGNM